MYTCSVFVILVSILNPLPFLHYIVAVFPNLFLLLAIIIIKSIRTSVKIKILVIFFLTCTNLFHVGLLRPSVLLLNEFASRNTTFPEDTPLADWEKSIGYYRMILYGEKFSPYISLAFGKLGVETEFESLIYSYAYQLTHPYKGTLDEVIRFFNRRGHPGETVFIDSEADSFAFYTHMKIIRKKDLKLSDRPDWIILRTGKIKLDSQKKIRYDIANKLGTILKTYPYKEFEWTGPLSRINNSYDIVSHHFKPTELRGTIRIYKLIKSP